MNQHSKLDAPELSVWWHNVAELVAAEAEHAQSVDEKVELLVEAARVYSDECGDFETALARLQDAHELSPTQAAVLTGLAELSARLERWREAVDWLTLAIDEEVSVHSRTALILKQAELLAMRLGLRAEAVEVLWGCLEEDPDSVEAMVLVAALLDPEDSDGRAELLRRRLAVVAPGPDAAELYLELASIEELQRGDLGAALEAYRAAHRLDQASRGAILGIYRCLIRAREWSQLFEFLSSPGTAETGQEALLGAVGPIIGLAHLELDVEPDDIRRLVREHGADQATTSELVGLASRAGVVLPTLPVLEGFPGAVVAYRAALTHESTGDIERAADLYEQALEVAPSMMVANHGLRRTSFYLNVFEDYRSATARFADNTTDPELRASLYSNLGLMAEFRQRDDMAAAQLYDVSVGARLSAIGAGSGHEIASLTDFVRVLEKTEPVEELDRRLGELLEECSEPGQRAWLCDRRAELSLANERSLDAAVRHYTRGLQYDPENQQAHRVRQDSLRRRRDWPSLLTALEQELNEAREERRLQLLDEVAQIQIQLGSPSSAEEAWREALVLEPDWFPAHVGLGQLLDAQGRWRELSEQLSQQLATMTRESAQRIPLLGRLGEIYEFRLDLPDRAQAAYREILSLKPGAPDAVAGLERTFGLNGDWLGLVNLLKSYVSGVEDELAAAEIHTRIGEILQVHLSDLPAAIEQFQLAVAKDPESEFARWGLEWLLIESGDHYALGAHYESETQRTDGLARLIILHKRLARGVGDPPEGVLEALAEANHDDPLVWWSMANRAATRANDSGIGASLVRLSEIIGPASGRRLLLREAGERLQGVAGSEAAAVWELLVGLSPSDERPWQALLTHYEDGLSLDELVNFAERLEGSLKQASSRSAALTWAGLRAVDDDDMEADRLFRRASEVCPDDVVPLWLLLQRGAYEDSTEQAQLLENLAGRVADKSQAAQLFYDAGVIREQTLVDRERALSDFHSALLAEPAFQPAADRVEQILIGQNRLEELLDLNTARAESTQDPKLKAELLLRSARAERRLNEAPARAVQYLERILESDPEDVSALHELAQVLVELGRDAEAASKYESLVEKANEDAVLANAYLELGRLREGAHGYRDAVVEYFRNAVSITPSKAALIGLGDAYLRSGEPELAQLTFRRLERAPDGSGGVATLGQVEALLAAERPSEALRRLKGAFSTLESSAATRARAAHILAHSEVVLPELHVLLSQLLTQSVDGSQSQILEVDEAPGVPALETAAAETSISASGTNDSASRGLSTLDDFEQAVTDPQHWEDLRGDKGAVMAYRDVSRWLRGQPTDLPASMPSGSVSQSVWPLALPAGLSSDFISFFGRVVRSLGVPLANPGERAEIAAEGVQARLDADLAASVRCLGERMDVAHCIAVRSVARPYTIDMYRRERPVLTFGGAFLDKSGESQAVFLAAGLIFSVAAGLPCPAYSMAGRAFGAEQFGAFLAELSRLFDCPMEAEWARAQGASYGELLQEKLSEEVRAELAPSAPEIFAWLDGQDIGALRSAIDQFTLRMAFMLCEPVSASLDAIRQINFDDRPREALKSEDFQSLVKENFAINDLLHFMQTEQAAQLRAALNSAADT